MANQLTREYLKSILHYCSMTGLFTWIARPRSHFKNDQAFAAWHTKFCGKPAGSPNKEYLMIEVLGRKQKCHRLAWLYVHGVMPYRIDHINHRPRDNRIENLRSVTCSQNSRNMTLSVANTSGFIGVSRHRNKWASWIKADGRHVHLGVFVDKNEAIQARKDANIKYGYHENHGMKRQEGQR